MSQEVLKEEDFGEKIEQYVLNDDEVWESASSSSSFSLSSDENDGFVGKDENIPLFANDGDNFKTFGGKNDERDTSDEEDLRNTIGNIPVSWYDELNHVGYDWDGKRISKPMMRSEIDEFLAKMEDPNYWRTVKDRQTGNEIVLSDEQIGILSNVQRGKYPKVGYNPYQPFIDFFTSEVEQHPLSNRPEHKRSFVPSKLDKIKVGRMVHAIKMGWMKPKKPEKSKRERLEDEEQREEQRFYDIWAASDQESSLTRGEQARLKLRIPAPKLDLPGHEESYNPPPEYLLTKEEEEKWKNTTYEDDPKKRDFLPQKYKSLRQVPAYDNMIRERFERCLDLYMAPRQRKMKLNVDPKDLLPDLPKPKDLQPFPTTRALVYTGHDGWVRSLSFEPKIGQFFASGSEDGSVRIWEVSNGRSVANVRLGRKEEAAAVVKSVAWCPNAELNGVVATAAGIEVWILLFHVGDKLKTKSTASKISQLLAENQRQLEDKAAVCQWRKADVGADERIKITISLKKNVDQVVWQSKGDFFATVSRSAVAGSVVVHQLSRLKSQVPFSKAKGEIQQVMFHPSKPLFFVATKASVRIYDLSKLQLVKKLLTNCKWISSMAVHPRGDNLAVASYDCRLSWFDMDLSAKPYKTFRHHKSAVRGVDFHPHYPLMASVSDDGCAIVYHAAVYNDLLQNPLIVPVKMLGDAVTEEKDAKQGGKSQRTEVLACQFHPRQPWLLTASSDNTLKLYVN